MLLGKPGIISRRQHAEQKYLTMNVIGRDILHVASVCSYLYISTFFMITLLWLEKKCKLLPI